MEFIEKYRNISLRNKLLLSYILIAIGPLILYSLISAAIMANQVQDTLTNNTSEMIEHVNTSIMSYFETMEDQLDFLCLSINNIEEEELYRLFDNFREGNSNINSIIYVKADDSYVASGSKRISRDLLVEDSWYKKAVQSDSKFIILDYNEGKNFKSNNELSSQEMYSFARKVTNLNGEIIGAILIDVSQVFIDKSVHKISIGNKGFVFISDSENNIIYSPINNIVWRIEDKFLQEKDELSFININDIDYCLLTKNIENSDWKVSGIFSYSLISQQFSNNLFLLIMIAILVILFSSITSILLSASITNPLLKLQFLMKEAEKGNLKVNFEALYNDEIGTLGRSFNSMISRIELLINEVYLAQKNKRKAELRTLEEQIKPHFLYNTLDTISWLAREKEAIEVVNLVEALTNMYRVGLSKGNSFVKVKDEIQHVNAYLFIQQVRYSDKLKYNINIDDFMLDFIVPKLILQPLVENAIYHGIKEKRSMGEINIFAFEENDNLVLSVFDNGVGINKDKLRVINNQLKSGVKAKESFGIFYVNEKIKLEYGDKYGLKISTEEGLYTQIDIRLPKIRGTKIGKN